MDIPAIMVFHPIFLLISLQTYHLSDIHVSNCFYECLILFFHSKTALIGHKCLLELFDTVILPQTFLVKENTLNDFVIVGYGIFQTCNIRQIFLKNELKIFHRFF